jgi:ADP-heptose:LPS heptosyltransferase
MIIISPYSKKLRNGKNNPKNYPFFKQLVELIDEPIVQIGIEGEEQLVEDFRKNLSLKELGSLVNECRTWISVDSFFQHFCWDLGKPGIVLWGQSDPNIFGHPENINMLKDRKYLREKQFWIWEQCEFRDDCWVSPEEVVKQLNK